MQSPDSLQQKAVQYRQKIDELESTCAGLKEELHAKELSHYDQEVRIRDLKSQLKELIDIEDKLQLANRNARVLEEENNTLLMKLKTGDGGKISCAPVRAEALKLIDENNKLRSELEELRAALNKSHQHEHQLEQKCRNFVEFQERSESQIAALKKQINDMDSQLSEKKNAWEIAEVWQNERARNLRDYEELLSSVRRYDSSMQHRDGRDAKERGNEQQLQQCLLKEDIAELEQKLHLAEDSFRAKEREWRKLEGILRSEINSLKGNKDHNSKEVYRAFQDQLKSFKEEVATFRGERRSGRTIVHIPVEESLLDDGDGRINELEANVKSKEGRIKALEAMSHHISTINEEISRENDDLREEIERLRCEIGRAEDRANEYEIRVKELEVLLAPSQKDTNGMKDIGLSKEEKGNNYADREKEMILEENRELHASLLRYEAEIADLKAGYGQQLILHDARQGEQRCQPVEPHRQSDSTRQRMASRLTSRKFSAADSLREYPELVPKENDQIWRVKNAADPFALNKLLKDKMDSVDDVMRALETAWAEEGEAKRNVKKVSHYSADLASMLEKDNDLHRCLQRLEDNERQRQKDLQRLQTEKEHLSDEFGNLKCDNRLKDSRIQELQGRIGMLEQRFSENGSSTRRHTETPKDSVMEGRIQKLEEAVAHKEVVLGEELSKAKDRKVRELSEQLATLKEANDGLWRQLVNIQDEKQEGIGHSSSGRASKTPRSSAHHRSLDNFGYSQPSTHVSEERKRNVVAEGAHLAVTIVELSDVARNGRPITEPGFIIIKVKSVKEKYKTSVKELASVIRFDETFVFYLAQPDQDVITLHVFYKTRSSSREYHIGDACFTMAMLYRGIPKQRIAIVAQNPGTRDAIRAARVEVIMQSDDFGKVTVPTDVEIGDECLRFNELLRRVEVGSPEDLHRVDVLMCSSENQWI